MNCDPIELIFEVISQSKLYHFPVKSSNIGYRNNEFVSRESDSSGSTGNFHLGRSLRIPTVAEVVQKNYRIHPNPPQKNLDWKIHPWVCEFQVMFSLNCSDLTPGIDSTCSNSFFGQLQIVWDRKARGCFSIRAVVFELSDSRESHYICFRDLVTDTTNHL